MTDHATVDATSDGSPPAATTLEVAVVQHDIVGGDRWANLNALGSSVTAAAETGARLVVLTEMFSTGFATDMAALSEPPDGPTVNFLIEQATRHGIWMVGSVCIATYRSELPQNVAVLAAPDGSIYTYAKRHLFSYAGEDKWMAPGADTLTVDVEGIRTSVFVCYDLRFADDFWRLAPDTDAYVVVANWPTTRVAHWRALLVARAIENQAWVLGANRVGTDDLHLEYPGDSLVVHPLGQIVAEGVRGEEMTLRARISAGQVADVRAEYPFMADRR